MPDQLQICRNAVNRMVQYCQLMNACVDRRLCERQNAFHPRECTHTHTEYPVRRANIVISWKPIPLHRQLHVRMDEKPKTNIPNKNESFHFAHEMRVHKILTLILSLFFSPISAPKTSEGSAF